tara:strand:+ start:12960 stop:13415 length:456 start_codon:yes stop_codon:yes gene_type:complete
MKKYIIISALMLTTLIVACSSSETASNQSDEISSPPAPAQVTGEKKTEKELSAQASAERGKLVEVQMLDGNSDNYVYEPANLTFAVGETITFKITSESEFHTFTIDELDIYETADGGETFEFTVTFETPGTYKLYCVPHETLGMIGEVVVQ